MISVTFVNPRALGKLSNMHIRNNFSWNCYFTTETRLKVIEEEIVISPHLCGSKLQWYFPVFSERNPIVTAYGNLIC